MTTLLFKLLLSLIFFTSINLYASDSCSKLFGHEEKIVYILPNSIDSIWQGKRIIERPNFLPLNSLDEYYLLGKGDKGGEVWRVVSSETGSVSTYKKHENAEVFNNDMQALNQLKSIESDLPFRVIKYSLVNSELTQQNIFKVQSIFGRTVYDILTDKSVPETIKKNVLDHYENIIGRIIKLAKHKFAAVPMVHKYLGFYYVYFQVENIRFAVHVKNLILESSSGEFVLIDPS